MQFWGGQTISLVGSEITLLRALQALAGAGSAYNLFGNMLFASSCCMPRSIWACNRRLPD
jgi:hypothetical protein